MKEKIKDLNLAELKKSLLDARRELMQLRLRGQQAGGKQEKPHKIGELRRNIARMCTAVRVKEVAA